MSGTIYTLLEAATLHRRDYTLTRFLASSAFVSSVLPLGSLLLVGSGVFDEAAPVNGHPPIRLYYTSTEA